jgi:hypothetical protein
MQITYGSVTLATGDAQTPMQDLRVDAQQVTDEFRGWKATDIIPLGRGNRTRRITLSTLRLFNTQREADEFYLTHFDDMANSATLSFTCGLPGDTSTVTCEAVVQSAVPVLLGVSVRVDYVFLAGPLTIPSS